MKGWVKEIIMKKPWGKHNNGHFVYEKFSVLKRKSAKTITALLASLVVVPALCCAQMAIGDTTPGFNYSSPHTGSTHLGPYTWEPGNVTYCIESGVAWDGKGDWRSVDDKEYRFAATLIQRFSDDFADIVQAAIAFDIHQNIDVERSKWYKDLENGFNVNVGTIGQLYKTADVLWKDAKRKTPMKAKITNEYTDAKRAGVLHVKLLNDDGSPIEGFPMRVSSSSDFMKFDNGDFYVEKSTEAPVDIPWTATGNGNARIRVSFEAPQAERFYSSSGKDLVRSTKKTWYRSTGEVNVSVDVPKADPPKVDVPQGNPPKTDVPKTDPPAHEQPKTNPPKVEQTNGSGNNGNSGNSNSGNTTQGENNNNHGAANGGTTNGNVAGAAGGVTGGVTGGAAGGVFNGTAGNSTSDPHNPTVVTPASGTTHGGTTPNTGAGGGTSVDTHTGTATGGTTQSGGTTQAGGASQAGGNSNTASGTTNTGNTGNTATNGTTTTTTTTTTHGEHNPGGTSAMPSVETTADGNTVVNNQQNSGASSSAGTSGSGKKIAPHSGDTSTHDDPSVMGVVNTSNQDLVSVNNHVASTVKEVLDALHALGEQIKLYSAVSSAYSNTSQPVKQHNTTPGGGVNPSPVAGAVGASNGSAAASNISPAAASSASATKADSTSGVNNASHGNAGNTGGAVNGGNAGNAANISGTGAAAVGADNAGKASVASSHDTIITTAHGAPTNGNSHAAIKSDAISSATVGANATAGTNATATHSSAGKNIQQTANNQHELQHKETYPGAKTSGNNAYEGASKGSYEGDYKGAYAGTNRKDQRSNHDNTGSNANGNYSEGYDGDESDDEGNGYERTNATSASLADTGTTTTLVMVCALILLTLAGGITLGRCTSGTPRHGRQRSFEGNNSLPAMRRRHV